MAIKVKHEGNATPAAFASKSGGEAKRRQQDAAAMASVMQQAANAGNQQLRGASAPGATPGKSSVQLVHAPLMGAPATPLLPRMGRPAIDRTPLSGHVTRPQPKGNVRMWNEDVEGKQGSIDFLPKETAMEQKARRRPDSITFESPQEQAAKQAEAQRRRDNEVVESVDQTGRHSPDATWDPTNGGRWVRPYRPGEKEALVRQQAQDVEDASWEWRYTEKQKMDMEKLRNAYADIQSDPSLSAADKDIMGQQILQQFYGFKKMPYEKEREDAATQRAIEKENREYEMRRQEMDLRRQENEEKRYQDFVLALSRGKKVTRPVTDETGAVTMETQFVPYEQSEIDAYTKMLYPNRTPGGKGAVKNPVVQPGGQGGKSDVVGKWADILGKMKKN